ncbi:hypothetical protein [Chryseobacterium sp.]|uniref:hypothetical protein n=1 Tax=Chryseobacterium sp. TaxID=1871047 RepID=UPI0035B4E606
MENNPKNSLCFSHKEQSKGKCFQAQMKRLFAALYRPSKTILITSIETGILRANICRYVAEWEKENLICIVQKGICPISKYRAGVYTTTLEFFPFIVEPSNTVKL